MTDERMSAAAESAWRAFADALEPDDRAQARVLQRLRARATERVDAAGEGTRRIAASLFVIKSSALSVGIATGALLAIKVAVVSVQALGRPQASVEPPPVIEPAKASEAAPRRASAPATNVAPPSAPAAIAGSPPAVSPTAPSRRVATPAVSPPASLPAADALRAELALMEQARTAVQAHEHARAHQLLVDHATRFPSGAMSEERHAWLAIIACERGDADAHDRAQRFATTHPKSTQLSAVRSACHSNATSPTDPSRRLQ